MKTEKYLWAAVVLSLLISTGNAIRDFHAWEAIRAHSDQLERTADQNHADKDLRKTWGDKWEARLARIEARLASRKIGDASPKGSQP